MLMEVGYDGEFGRTEREKREEGEEQEVALFVVLGLG